MPRDQGESVSNCLELMKISEVRHREEETDGAFQASGERSAVAKSNRPVGSEASVTWPLVLTLSLSKTG